MYSISSHDMLFCSWGSVEMGRHINMIQGFESYGYYVTQVPLEKILFFFWRIRHGPWAYLSAHPI